MKRKNLYITLLLLIFCVSINIIYFQEFIPVYKDRERWEKTNKIIWHVPTTKKVVALTFDDGPSPTFTPIILDLLKKYNAKATFFVLGQQAERFPGIVKMEAQQGHNIGNHMFTHNIISKLPLETIITDLKHTHDIIYELSGSYPHFFRPPDGYYDEKVVRAAETFNYTVVIWTWTQDTRDWSKISSTAIAKKVIENVQPGDIILFHDQGGDRSNTVDALKIILPSLLEKGYSFVTLHEMVNLHLQ